MAFLPKEFGGPEEHPRPHFPAHDIGPLVDVERQVPPRLHPAAHRMADHGFRGWANDQRLFELCIRIDDKLPVDRLQPVMRDDRHLLGEPLNMIGFLLEEGQRDEEREITILYACRLDARIHQLLDAFPDPIAPGADDHATAHARFLGQIGLGDDLLIPVGKILGAGDGKSVFHARPYAHPRRLPQAGDGCRPIRTLRSA